ncbi:SusC/RagA family TonB-linked outer membrane protein [Pedobacter sp. MW01-1-1]|uniref:SusC/RagA family TonB-linked outer membrane protein n=1 Tax=Pedobacter sp. MW01-1-1 TaxID=3383027 RepID=UPI003FEDD110
MNLKLLRKLSWIFVFTMLICSTAFAQQQQIRGKVLDKKDGQPIPGVTIGIRGKTNNVVTNDKGEFALLADPATDVLVFSFVGYIRQMVPLAGKSTLSVSLVEDQANLDDVVVVGYGTKKKTDVLGSVASISGAEIQDIPAPNLAGALRGQVAGVSVDQASGRPGSPITLNIRNAAISETAQTVGITDEPLIIIDGITVTKEAFDNIDASMVENISFLKDASAAIYGAAGAKGVVLVTTKRGKIGKPTLSYNGYFGISDAAREPEMLSAYDHALLLNDGYRQSGAALSNFFLPADLELIKSQNFSSWYDEIWQPASTQRHNISLSGGSEKITFFAGGSYQNEEANFIGMNYDKYSFRSGVVATIVEGLKADINFNVDWNIRKAQHNLTDDDQAFIERIITIPQWVPNSIDGKYVNFNNAVNPLALINSGYYENRKARGYRINASLTYQPKFVKGLTGRFQISQGSTGTNTRQYRPNYQLYNFTRTGNNNQLFTNQLAALNPVVDQNSAANQRVIPGLAETNSYQGFLTLQYGRTFGKHTFDVLAGAEQTESNSETLSVLWSNQLIPGAEEYWGFDVNTITRQNVSRDQSAKRSVFGRASYDFDKKYLMEFVIRSDASSNFAPGNRWGLSPSLGLGWVISQESFFKNSNALRFMNFLKLKVNYGITGDDRVNSRLWQARYTIDTNNGYIYGNTNANGLNPSFVPNPDITWEKKRTLNIGLESAMFNNKLNILVEAFQNRNFDAFDRGANSLYPLYAGFTAPVINYRETYNWGTEFTVGYKAKLATDLNLSTSVNFSYGNSVNTQLIYANGDLINNVAPDWPIEFGTDPRKYNSGNIGLRNIGMFRTQADVDAWMAKYPNYRIYTQIPQAGWLYYEDTNEDGVITDNDMVPLYDKTNSWFAGAFNINLTYKEFSLSTNIAARFGGKTFYDSKARSAPSTTRNVISIWNDRWTQANPMEGKFPRFDDPSIAKNSDFWALDATTVRINNMTFAYKVPTKFANKIGLQGAKLMVTGNNLWTIVNPFNYKDPYSATAYDYPILRTISFGLNVNL